MNDKSAEDWQDNARALTRRRRRRNLYVITLHPDVLDRREFRAANPGYIEGMPCVYVGMTIHDPGDRYRQHKSGYKSSKYPRRYGVELALELIEGFDESAFSEDDKEQALAEWLRRQGIAVWQH